MRRAGKRPGCARISNFGTLLLADRVLVGLTAKSDLVCYKPSRRGYEEIVQYNVGDPPFHAFPLLSGDGIYIRDRDSITLWRLGLARPAPSL